MHKIGFRNICARYFETDLRLGYDVAVDQFKQWKVDMRFVEEYGGNLRDYGLEFPLEHVVVCEKF